MCELVGARSPVRPRRAAVPLHRRDEALLDAVHICSACCAGDTATLSVLLRETLRWGHPVYDLLFILLLPDLWGDICLGHLHNRLLGVVEQTLEDRHTQLVRVSTYLGNVYDLQDVIPR